MIQTRTGPPKSLGEHVSVLSSLAWGCEFQMDWILVICGIPRKQLSLHIFQKQEFSCQHTTAQEFFRPGPRGGS